MPRSRRVFRSFFVCSLSSALARAPREETRHVLLSQPIYKIASVPATTGCVRMVCCIAATIIHAHVFLRNPLYTNTSNAMTAACLRHPKVERTPIYCGCYVCDDGVTSAVWPPLLRMHTIGWLHAASVRGNCPIAVVDPTAATKCSTGAFSCLASCTRDLCTCV